MYLFVPTFLPSLASFLHVPFTTLSSLVGDNRGVREGRHVSRPWKEGFVALDRGIIADDRLLERKWHQRPVNGPDEPPPCFWLPVTAARDYRAEEKGKGRRRLTPFSFFSRRSWRDWFEARCRCSITLEGVCKLDFSSWLFYARLKLLTCLFDWMWIRYFELLRF